MNRKVLAGTILAAFLLVAILTMMQLPGCGGGDGGGGTPSGSLKVAITDSPAFRDFSSVHIRIDKVVVVPAGMENTPDSDPGLLTIADFTSQGGVDVDILSLHFLQQVLVPTALIPPGTYNQVRLILAPNPSSAPFNNYFILAGSSQQVALTTPSAQETGVKIVGRFTVMSGVLSTILLDFDPNKAIVKRGKSGQNNLKPTGIRIIQILTSLENAGSISGLIHTPVFNLHSSSTFRSWSSAMVTVRKNTTDIVSGAVFSNFSSPDVWKGPFTAFVPAGSGYKVFVDTFRDTNLKVPAPFQRYSSPLITVTQGVDTPVPPLDGLILLKAL